MPSLSSKVTLLLSCGVTGGIVYFVHHRQVEDRAILHRGIVRDLERQQTKKTENIKRLQEQQELTRAYREKVPIFYAWFLIRILHGK